MNSLFCCWITLILWYKKRNQTRYFIGAINVNGGDGYNGGGGGGGLISLVYISGNVYGELTSYGGYGHGGGNAGGAGVIYLGKDVNGASPDRRVSFWTEN